MSQDLG